MIYDLYFNDLNHDFIGFRFDTAENIKSLGTSDDIGDQITGRNDDYSLGIPRAKLELKHAHNMFIS